MTKNKTAFFLFALMGLCSYAVRAQEQNVIDTSRIENLGLEELIKLESTGVSSELEKQINEKVGVASKKPLSTRKSPSILSVITEEEIKKSGARDMIDVLRMVPGFDFGVDVTGVIGLGIRGNWAQEGKVLLLLDGQEMNETLYGSLNFGNNFPIQHIKKIEIIRGPGSAIYGGYAEYGVINIITKSGEETNGVEASVVYGQMEKDFARRNLSLSIGKKIKDWDISLAGLIGQGNRSDQNYTDIYGNSYNMGGGNAQLNPSYINLGVAHKDLSFRFIYDRMYLNTQDGNDAIYSKAYENSFTSYFAEMKYNWRINKKLTITPKFNFKRQIPWYFGGGADSIDNYPAFDIVADRYRMNITSNWEISNKVNLVSGVEYFGDYASSRQDSAFTKDGQKSTTINYNNFAGFAQLLINNRIVNLTIGARLDHNSSYGSAFVPRLGLTKKIGLLNFKLLYSNSFRAPSIQNVQVSSGTIKPEISQVIEFETGIQVSRNSYLTLNLFDISTQNPIIYYTDSLGNDGYRNRDRSGSQGLELEYKVKHAWGYFNVNYSFYTNGNKPVVPEYQVQGVSGVALAFPTHKINLNASVLVTKHFSISPSGSFLSKRYAYTGHDSTTASDTYKALEPVFLFNLYLNYKNLGIKGLDVGMGVYDIFQQRIMYVQPYNSGHAPLPGTSRELVVRLTYNLGFKK